MTMEMEAKSGVAKSIELLQEAIEQLSESKPFQDIQIQTQNQISPTANRSGDETQILTKLISQLESLKEEGMINQSESSKKANEEEHSSTNEAAASAEDIVKDLKDVKKQNTVTHWLLSGMIVLTVVWQLSEGLLILKLSNGVNHPFRSLWSWFKGMVITPTTNGQDADKQSSSSVKHTLVESAHLPLRLTNDITQMDLGLPSLGSGKDE